MDRRKFLAHSLAGSGLLLASENIPQSALAATESAEAPKFPAQAPDSIFPYRGWAFCIYGNDWDLLEKIVDEALARAADHGINTFELHDQFGFCGIVDTAVQYKNFPKLAAQGPLTWRGHKIDRAQRERDYERLRRLAKRIKDQGISLNVWYHVMRDAPEELAQAYPEIRSLDSGFIWTWLDGLLTEFFERLPEVDRLTITSLHETPSIMNNTGSLAREERLLKLYMTIYEACRRAGKELIIRDFIIKPEDLESFWRILEKLPPDIYLMTKDIFADWTHLELPPNPFMHRYQGRKLIVEFDLYGEYLGRLDMPACYPEYIYRHIRHMKSLGAIGAMGRLVHDHRRSHTFETIFESPNAINAYAFAHYLSNPFPWLGQNVAEWYMDIDSFDRKIWVEWAGKRYGDKATVALVRAFDRTARIMSLTFNLGGDYFNSRSMLPKAPVDAHYHISFDERVETLGIEFIRDEKRQALALAAQSLDDIRSAENALTPKDFKQLIELFESVQLIIRGFQAVIEGYYQFYQVKMNNDRKELKSTADAIRKLAEEITRERGEDFYEKAPATLRTLAADVEAGVTHKNAMH